MARSDELLVLKYQDFRSEAAKFFKELNRDPALRSLFFKNPSLVLNTKLPSLAGLRITDLQHDVANRLLYSVLSNDKFKEFLRSYQKRKNDALARLLKNPDDKEAANELDERAIKAEFAEAFLKFGDKELLHNIFSSNQRGGGTVAWSPFAIAFLVLAVAVAVHAVLFLGTSGDFAPTSTGRLPIPAADLKKIADQLVATAMEVRAADGLIK
jgi:hypothetical protein